MTEQCRYCRADLPALIDNDPSDQQYFAVEGFCSPQCGLMHLLHDGCQAAKASKTDRVSTYCTLEFANRCYSYLWSLRPKGYPRRNNI